MLALLLPLLTACGDFPKKLDDAYKLGQSLGGGDSPEVQKAKEKASALLAQHKLKESEAVLEEATKNGPDRAHDALKTLALIYAMDNQPGKAESVCLKLANGDKVQAAGLLHYIGCPMVMGGHPQSARPVLERAAALYRQAGGEQDKGYVKDKFFLARCDAAEGNRQAALASYRAVLPELRKAFGDSSKYTHACQVELSKLEHLSATASHQ